MKRATTIGVSLLFFAACAATAPKELLNARTAYNQASAGPAADANPAGLHSAKESLDAAEDSFSKHGATQETNDIAYVAGRRAQIAEANAREVQAIQRKEQQIAQASAAQGEQLQQTSADLERAKTQLGATHQQLADERQRREEAERQAAAALAAFATVKQEPRGMVITLSGSVLFASNKAELLPSARVKLNEVADALTKQDPKAKIIVEGNTDSQGSAPYNQELSRRRAESVRNYIVSRGFSADRIQARGNGLTNPIADNKSPEGRANNRRVEIVVQPVGAAQ